MEAVTCLMLGCGTAEPKRRIISPDTVGAPELWTTLDIDPALKPDVVYDLDDLNLGARLPFEDEHFDEIHAYEVLEHFGVAGNYGGFFAMWREFWRILRPNGYLCGSSPAYNSPWAWGDPGHTRIIGTECLTYLVKDNYKQLGKTSMTDYRSHVAPYWWKVLHTTSDSTFTHWFALQKDTSDSPAFPTD